MTAAAVDELLFRIKDLKINVSDVTLKKSLLHKDNHSIYVSVLSKISKEIILNNKMELSIGAPHDLPSWSLSIFNLVKELDEDSILLSQINHSLCPEVKIPLLSFLLTECKCSRLLSFPRKKSQNNDECYISLKKILNTLSISPSVLSLSNVFETIRRKVHNGQNDPILLLKTPLSDNEWSLLEDIKEECNMEYSLRSNLLLTRLETTVSSFCWSRSRKENEQKENILRMYTKNKKELLEFRSLDLSDLIASTESIIFFTKLSSQKYNSSLGKITMGAVPDRGGRPKEGTYLEREMPKWMPRDGSRDYNNSSSGSSYRGRGHQRGSFTKRPRVQGAGWNK